MGPRAALFSRMAQEEEKEEGLHLPRVAAETGRMPTHDPVAPGVELAAT